MHPNRKPGTSFVDTEVQKDETFGHKHTNELSLILMDLLLLNNNVLVVERFGVSLKKGSTAAACLNKNVSQPLILLLHLNNRKCKCCVAAVIAAALSQNLWSILGGGRGISKAQNNTPPTVVSVLKGQLLLGPLMKNDFSSTEHCLTLE